MGSWQWGREGEEVTEKTVTFTTSVPRFVEFITLNPGRQMIGSFHPLSDTEFFRDAYQPPPPQPFGKAFEELRR